MLTQQYGVEKDASSPDVGLVAIVLLLLAELRTHVLRGAAERRLLPLSREAEVDQFGFVIFKADKNVFHLDVSVRNIVYFQVCQTFQDLF